MAHMCSVESARKAEMENSAAEGDEGLLGEVLRFLLGEWEAT